MAITPRNDDDQEIYVWYIDNGRFVVCTDAPDTLCIRTGYAGEDRVKLKEIDKMIADLSEIAAWMRAEEPISTAVKPSLTVQAALILATLEAEAKEDAKGDETGISSNQRGCRVHYYPKSNRFNYYHGRGVDTKAYVLATIEHELSNAG